jgi:hypothetical protein
MFDTKRRIPALALALLAYLVSFPEDAEAITLPVATVLNLTSEISPWFYGLAAVGIVAAAAAKIGRRAGT